MMFDHHIMIISSRCVSNLYSFLEICIFFFRLHLVRSYLYWLCIDVSSLIPTRARALARHSVMMCDFVLIWIRNVIMIGRHIDTCLIMAAIFYTLQSINHKLCQIIILLCTALGVCAERTRCVVHWLEAWEMLMPTGSLKRSETKQTTDVNIAWPFGVAMVVCCRCRCWWRYYHYHHRQ